MRLKPKRQYEAGIARTRARRMKWWHEARFGMFVHWGLYSVIGRHEWAMAIESIARAEYEKLAAKPAHKRGARSISLAYRITYTHTPLIRQR